MRQGSSQASAETAQRLGGAAGAAAGGDFEGALSIWVELGHAGVARAQAEIGRCFVNGWGVERDIELARKWLKLAANSGDPLGQRVLGDFYFNGEEGSP